MCFHFPQGQSITNVPVWFSISRFAVIDLNLYLITLLLLFIAHRKYEQKFNGPWEGMDG